MLSPDIPGQAYLFQGPEVSELARLRGRNSPSLLDQLIKMMHNVFFIFGEEMENESDYNRRPDEDELYEEMNQYAEMYMTDYQFDDDKMWSMVRFLSSPAEDTRPTVDPAEESSEPDDDDLRDVIKSAIGSNIPSAEEFRKLYDEMSSMERSVVKFNEGKNYANAAMDFNANSVTQGWQQAITRERDGYDGSEIFQDALAAFTSEVLQAIGESNNTSVSYYNRSEHLMDEELPKWLPEADFHEELRDHSRSIEWYIDEHKDGHGGLAESAAESIGQNDAENFNEKKREWEHRYGFDIIEYLAPGYDEEDESDPRRDVSLVQIANMAQMIADEGWLVEGGTKAAQKASAITFAIKELASRDETLKFVFSHDLNMMTWDPRNVTNGIEELARDNGQYLFGPLADQVARMKERQEQQAAMEAEQRQLAEEQQRQEQQRRFEEQQLLEDAKHQMLPRLQETTTPEQLEKMRELGIAKRPFGHETQLSRGTFPGAGPFEDLQGMMPFTMSIAPTKDYVDKGKIPPELMRNTLLHTVQTEGQPALGWIGGFADYNNKILYIAEVQSDLMQRTGKMRDPEKVQQQRKQEVGTIQQQITNTQAKIQNAVSPKQQITQKLDTIRQENASLSPGDSRLQRNQGIVDNLLRQLPNIPDTVDTRNLELTLQSLNQSLAEAQQRLEESINAKDETNYFTPKYRPWHDYKSKVENTFKEWIPLFFNAAFRLARDKEYAIVRIITADDLMTRWDKYARPETRTLFERVYDQTAKFYGAQQTNLQGKTWWEVKMNPDLRIANWLQRLTKTAQQHQWFTQDPNTGKYIWQTHMDQYFQSMQPMLSDQFSGESKQTVFGRWYQEIPPDLKEEPNFQEAVRQYVLQTQGFDPYAAGEIQEPKTSWQSHLDAFFQTMEREAPEMMGEQWEAQTTDYAANEGKRSVFQEWLKNVPDGMKMGNDLNPAFKKVVRRHLMETQGFDPYEFEEAADITPSVNELNDWLG